MDGGMIMNKMSKQDKWYNLGYGIGAVNMEELNKQYCLEYYSLFGKMPEPTHYSRPVLINEIRKLQMMSNDSTLTRGESVAS
jgi:hypothetical protein